MNRKSSKLLYLKENISIRVICLGWEDLITHWYKNGKAFTPEDVALYLKMIVSNQQPHSIPTKPLVFPPAQMMLTKIGT